jgi:competence protein ComEC
MKNNAPLFLPSLSLALGAWASFHLTSLSVPLLVGLAVLGLALRRPAGACVAALAIGMIVASVQHDLPGSPVAGFDLDRPVEAVVRVSGHWAPDSPDDEPGWSAPAEVLRLRQDGLVARPELEVLLHVPGAEDPPPFGTSLRLKAYLGRSSGFANRVPVEPGPWRVRVKSRSLMDIEAPPGPIAALSVSLRGRVEKAFQASGPDGTERGGKALARALVLGDASDFPLEWKRGLRVTGLYHLLSVSGVHVALVAGAVWLLAGWLPRVLRLALMLAAIALYLLLVGPLPALVRAAVMGFLTVTALLAERPPAAVNALGWAVILLVLERPDIVLSVAFQLTVSATAGLLLLGPLLAERWSRLPHWLASPLAASVGAQLPTIPWALPRFHLLSPLAPLFNLPAVPWTGLALGASLLWTGAALISPRIAGALLPVLDFLAAPFSWPARTGPSVWLPVPLALSPLAAWLLALLLALLLFARLKLLSLAGIAGIALLLSCNVPRDRGVELAMLDVGQGDAILLRDGKHAVLVDGGGWRTGDLGGRVLLPALLAEGVRSLDAVVMTHPDRDHCGGLVDIAAYLPVREVWMGPLWEPEGCAGRLATLPGAKVRKIWAGETAAVGKWTLRVLHPDRDEDRGINERSLVIRAEALGRSFLLTGDIESWAEMRLLSCCEREVQVDFLKVAHHGSKTSSTESFLDAARPRLALVSAGVKNLYHHPSPVILDRLTERGIRVLRTDRDGMILFRLFERRTQIELPGAPR